MTAKRKKPVEIQRRVSGISLKGQSRVGTPMCHLVYEIWWSDGSTTFERGGTVYGAAFQIDPKTHKVPKNNRPDLYAPMQAASLLVDVLTEACIVSDGMEKKV